MSGVLGHSLAVGVPLSLSTVHDGIVIAFKNKKKTQFVDGEVLYVARYNSVIVLGLWMGLTISHGRGIILML